MAFSRHVVVENVAMHMIESETRVSSCFPDDSAPTGDVKTVVAPLTSEKETKANVISHRRNDEVKTGESPKPDSACDSMTSIQGGALDASESHCGHPPPVTSDTHSETESHPLTSGPKRARSVKDLQALCDHPPLQSSVLDCIFCIQYGIPASGKDYSLVARYVVCLLTLKCCLIPKQIKNLTLGMFVRNLSGEHHVFLSMGQEGYVVMTNHEFYFLRQYVRLFRPPKPDDVTGNS